MHQLFMGLLALCFICVIPAFLFGFQLAVWTGCNWLIPVPALACCIAAMYFGHKAEEAL